jgi:ferrous iron transport protein A
MSANGAGAVKHLSLGEQVAGFRGRILPHTNGGVSWRIRELGFVPGTTVAVLRRGPLGDPIHIELRGYRICLRKADLASLHVESIDSVAT